MWTRSYQGLAVSVFVAPWPVVAELASVVGATAGAAAGSPFCFLAFFCFLGLYDWFVGRGSLDAAGAGAEVAAADAGAAGVVAAPAPAPPFGWPGSV